MLSIEAILALLSQYGYALLFPISILEGPVVAMLAGALVSFHVFNGITTYLVLLAGDLVGDVIYYGIGILGRKHISPKWRARIGVTDARIEKLERAFQKHDWKLLLLGKSQPIGSAVLFVAGLIHMPFWRFFFYNLLGTVPKVAIFMLAGYYFAESYRSFSGFLNYGSIISIAIALVLLAAYWIVRKQTSTEADNIS
jgi:membrane-associated protein